MPRKKGKATSKTKKGRRKKMITYIAQGREWHVGDRVRIVKDSNYSWIPIGYEFNLPDDLSRFNYEIKDGYMNLDENINFSSQYFQIHAPDPSYLVSQWINYKLAQGVRPIPGEAPDPVRCIWFSDIELVNCSHVKKTMMDSVILPDGHLEAIMQAINQTKPEIKEKIFNKWKLGEVLEKGFGVTILFYGPPGTGKTLAAQAIAAKINRKLKIIGSAEIQSSEPGGAERAIKAYFKEAKDKNHVLLFDECDSLIYDRGKVGMILAAEINCLLSEIEQFDGVCIFTTNNTPVLDKAMERRITLKLHFPKPNKEMRAKIWRRFFPEPDGILHESVNFDDLARYVISGGQIKNIVLNAARRAAYLGKITIEHDDLVEALRQEETGHTAFNLDFPESVLSTDYIGTDTGAGKTIKKVVGKVVDEGKDEVPSE